MSEASQHVEPDPPAAWRGWLSTALLLVVVWVAISIYEYIAAALGLEGFAYLAGAGVFAAAIFVGRRAYDALRSRRRTHRGPPGE